MNRFRQRHSEAAERAAERRRREDEAPRLKDEVPTLDSLRLELQEHRAGAVVAETAHVRCIPVAHAPALFELPCHDTFCKEGGHDVTRAILRALQSGATHFEGEDRCEGRTGSAECQRVLKFVGQATYKK
ncbi:MAG TPA: hypothetical protein VFQ61_16935 [Polyangiaceae bacterium]|nr:hypothetical protein [Polyangiaceae bacterium]